MAVKGDQGGRGWRKEDDGTVTDFSGMTGEGRGEEKRRGRPAPTFVLVG